MKRKLYILLAIVAVVIVAAGAAGSYAYYKIKKEPWAKQDAWVYVRSDMSTYDVLGALAETGGDTRGVLIDMTCRLYKLQSRIAKGATGAYHIKVGMSMGDVIRKIALRQQDPVKLTFIGTRTLPELAGKLSHCIEADSLQILEAMYAPDFLSDCGCDSANVCSVFLPDTYEVYWTITPEKLMQRMLSEYKKFWTDARRQQAQSLRLSPWQVSIICSIAEEETANREERGVVARLYWNRFSIGMPLQADPTVKYATGDFALRRILTKHLQANSPYNTYMHVGLPPGPIRVVEKVTIDTFLKSQPHQYLYMCAKEDFSGLHNFAKTLAQHNLNASRYHHALSQRGIR